MATQIRLFVVSRFSLPAQRFFRREALVTATIQSRDKRCTNSYYTHTHTHTKMHELLFHRHTHTHTHMHKLLLHTHTHKDAWTVIPQTHTHTKIHELLFHRHTHTHTKMRELLSIYTHPSTLPLPLSIHQARPGWSTSYALVTFLWRCKRWRQYQPFRAAAENREPRLLIILLETPAVSPLTTGCI